ncbi:MAG: hypothetical protein WA162_01845 [Thermodesulfobacteriota bacterium]
MKKYFLVFIAILCSLSSAFAETYWAGELPNIKDTSLKAEVIVDKDIFTYSYSISSGYSNTGQIWSFDIDIRYPEGSIALSDEGLKNGPDDIASTNVLSLPETPKMIPVGLWSPPDWNSGLSVVGMAGWGSDDKQYRISPGRYLTGFRIMSRGLPGIRDFRIEPKLIPPSEEEDEDEENEIAKIQAVEDKAAYHGKTLGPTAPPADFKPLEFIDYIVALKHAASTVTLGWIKNKGVENSLDVKLENAKKAIERNNIAAAKNMLSAFINEVEAQGCATYSGCPAGKHLTPEAYGLLKYNAQYLMERL